LKNSYILLAKKELDRFFGDWRMIVNALFFPGIMLFFVYAILIPQALSLLTKTTTQFLVYVVNPTPIVQSVLEYGDINLIPVLEVEEESLKKAIASESKAFLLIFPPDFERQISVYDVSSGENAPEIQLYYNSLTKGFTEQYGKLMAILSAWESSMAKKFIVNKSGGGDLAENKDKAGYFLSMILPMFLMMFMFYGAMAVTIGAITGEKEKGTFAAILIVPISTRELAAGKILGLGIETILCGISGALGVILSLPRLINSLDVQSAIFHNQPQKLAINLDLYNLSDYASLFLIVFSVSYLIVVTVALVSICAKTVREAQMFLAPIIMVLMTMSLLGAVYNNRGLEEWYYCFIPFYSTIQILSGIFNRNYTILQILLTLLSNLIYSFFGTEILSRLFMNEKIMFRL